MKSTLRPPLSPEPALDSASRATESPPVSPEGPRKPTHPSLVTVLPRLQVQEQANLRSTNMDSSLAFTNLPPSGGTASFLQLHHCPVILILTYSCILSGKRMCLLWACDCRRRQLWPRALGVHHCREAPFCDRGD